jgi:hypothetical protein
LTITEAIRTAHTTHALYFLLTAYVETLVFAQSIPDEVRSLPIRGNADVAQRSRVMKNVVQAPAPEVVAPKLEEAAGVFSVASEQLEKLSQDANTVNRKG